MLALDPVSFRARFRRRRASLRLAAGDRVARDLARYASSFFARWKPSGLLLSGGLTAAAVCEELGIGELELKREVFPGVVVSEAEGPHGRVSVVTKPGGFGGADALVRLAAWVAR